MKPYPLRDDQAHIDQLPPLDPAAGYEVLEGDPRTGLRMDGGTAQSVHRLGIWTCSPGVFRCTEKGNELQTVLEGRLRVTDESGETVEYGPGDSFYTSKGEVLIWDVVEAVKKVFFTWDSDGGTDPLPFAGPGTP